MPQLSFSWPTKPSYAPEDFIVSPANEDAFHFLERWPDAHSRRAALLSGPEACGKTHLSHCWAARTGAIFIAPESLGGAGSAALWQRSRHAVLENIDAVSDETALFHLIRHTEAHDVHLLLTSRTPAALLAFTLPDLRSRLLALPALSIGSPDEVLLRIYLHKCFADRQLRISDGVADFLIARMDRSFLAAYTLVERAEALSVEQKKNITIALARQLFL